MGMIIFHFYFFLPTMQIHPRVGALIGGLVSSPNNDRSTTRSNKESREPS